MTSVLVVDDSATDRVLAGRLLEKHDGTAVSYAANGREALDALQIQLPDLIVSDLQMPEMDGLALVEEVRREHPSIPVVLMTARGSEQIAAEALRRGAASYVPKVCLSDDLVATVSRVLAAARADRLHSRLMHSLDECDCRFRLRNDPELIDPLIAHFQEMLRCLPLEDEAERLRVGVAVKHAVWIAHDYGNLEMPLNSDASDRELRELAAARRREPPYCDRTLFVSAQICTEQAIFSIRYAGPPIDMASLPENIEAAAVDHGLLGGFVFLPTVMDDVRFDGCEISLLKKAVREDFSLDVGED